MLGVEAPPTRTPAHAVFERVGEVGQTVEVVEKAPADRAVAARAREPVSRDRARSG